ncbi:hypothetical protein DERF_007199 [Dermatophagoides farinae]|uniref:BHLH domain-containing protein n=1 Tax=Dermatophagoides farinae TaxID=6954 RepID=A0A922L2V6_DERFA|nr:hypothetical protein DERF_007199 [Dermatophagoides farinae]
MDSTVTKTNQDHNDQNDQNKTKMTIRKEKIVKVSTGKKYNLRIKSNSTSSQQSSNINRNVRNESRNPIVKHKPPPLSKYRRKTANLRERCRMQEINDAFKRLQSVVPDIFSITDERSSQSMAKLTKINTLKLAVNYISALTQILRQPETESECPNYGHDNENIQPSSENHKDKATISTTVTNRTISNNLNNGNSISCNNSNIQHVPSSMIPNLHIGIHKNIHQYSNSNQPYCNTSEPIYCGQYSLNNHDSDTQKQTQQNQVVGLSNMMETFVFDHLIDNRQQQQQQQQSDNNFITSNIIDYRQTTSQQAIMNMKNNHDNNVNSTCLAIEQEQQFNHHHDNNNEQMEGIILDDLDSLFDDYVS